MVQLVTRKEFAKIAGVSGAAVTKASKHTIAAAVVGNRIDAVHPAATAYVAKQYANKAPGGPDPLFQNVADACTRMKKYSANFVAHEFHIGHARAKELITALKVAGYIKSSTVTVPTPIPEPPKKPHVRGPEARRETRKLEPPPEFAGNHVVPDHIEAFADMTLRDIISQFGTDTRFHDWLKATKEIEMIGEKRLKNATTRGELVSRELVKVGVIEPIETAHIKLLTDGAKTIARRMVAMHDAGRDVSDVEKFVSEQITSFIRPLKAKIARTLKHA